MSAEDGEPILGASVTVKGTTIGTSTDFQGKFSLSVPASTRTVTVSYIGMVTQEATVAPVMNIRMESSAEKLDEVVVTAMGISRSIWMNRKKYKLFAHLYKQIHTFRRKFICIIT